MLMAQGISKWSQDPSTQVGSVITSSDHRILSLGYNGFPRGVEDHIERYENKPLKYKLVCHAERNALDNALFDVSRATIFSTLFTCNECAKSIIQRGIRRVVAPTPDLKKDNPFNWAEALLMYKESGVKTTFLDNLTSETDI
jgi:dCMP deaminase